MYSGHTSSHNVTTKYFMMNITSLRIIIMQRIYGANTCGIIICVRSKRVRCIGTWLATPISSLNMSFLVVFAIKILCNNAESSGEGGLLAKSIFLYAFSRVECAYHCQHRFT